MTDRLFLRPPAGPLDRNDWKAVSFISSTKAILLRCIREKGLHLSPEARFELAGYPSTFAAWKASHGIRQAAANSLARAE